ncbi:MAG: hypothetical protein LBG12_04330 [Synergistaceae bacterium]|jgi:hypothetical protein|nr:hypothetical protein [Synergistaceae bacterium]
MEIGTFYAEISQYAPYMMIDISDVRISLSALKMMLDGGGTAAYLMMGGFIGSVGAAFVGVFSKRDSKASWKAVSE